MTEPVVTVRQATVRHFDPATRSGSVLLDSGVELTFAPGTVDRSLLLLRLGQRVRLGLSDGEVVSVSFPVPLA